MSPIKSALVAFVALVAYSGVASASEVPDEYRTERFTVADLNLDSEAGAKTFLKRADKAAERVCGGKPDAWAPFAIQFRREYFKCHKTAMKDAVAQAHSEMVTAYFSGTAGRVTVLASR